MRKTSAVVAVVSMTVLLAGCAALGQPPAAPVTATAELRNAQGQAVGNATLSEVAGGVRVIVEARSLPAGVKGVHIHAVGKCEPPGFTTAGAHFNPTNRKHGLQNPDGPHAGDLPNITIGADGNGRLESLNDRITLGGGANSLFDADGSAIVVHAAADDFKTDPTGNSGDRIACGVVQKR
jgi:Cu-Zn family superoxide dismutase